jgi:hypothetical protein
MVTFAHTAPDCAEIMWNEQNWTLVSMPITSTRAQWDEGLRTVRQFNDLLRVLPPVPKAIARSAARRNGSPGRPLAPPAELPPGRSDVARPGRRIDRAERVEPGERVEQGRTPPPPRAARPSPRSYQR